MRYPIAIEKGGGKHAFGVVVPDLPGCFSAGDTLDEAIVNAREAIELWLETVLEDGGTVPEPTPIDEHQKNKEFDGWIWALADIDLSRLEGKVKRVNITIPENVLNIIDEAARREGESRSGFMARAALEKAIAR